MGKKGQCNGEYNGNDHGFILKYFIVKEGFASFALVLKWLLGYKDQKCNKP